MTAREAGVDGGGGGFGVGGGGFGGGGGESRANGKVIGEEEEKARDSVRLVRLCRSDEGTREGTAGLK